MNNKKLIATIIGVVAFILLIAGATFAWVTRNLSVTNGNYNTRTMNFVVDYSNNDGSITSIPLLTEATPSTASHVTVSAKRASNSAPGDLTLYLNTDKGTTGGVANTTEALLESGAINYAVCIGTCSSFDSITTKGVIDENTSIKFPILSGTPLTDEYTNYNVYFWLDSSLITENEIGSKYTGHISAEAIQVDTR